MKAIRNYFEKRKITKENNNKFLAFRKHIESNYKYLLRIDESKDLNDVGKDVTIYGWFNFDKSFKDIEVYEFICHKKERVPKKLFNKFGLNLYLKATWEKSQDMIVYRCTLN